MFSVKDEKILALVPDYRINLLTPGSIDDGDFGKFKTTLAEAFQYIKYSKDKVALYQMVHDNPKFRTMDRRTVELINGITGSGIDYKKDEEVVDVCLAIELMKQEAAEKAAEEAAEKAAKKAREETMEEAMITSIRNLMETTQWTADQAMAALKIPEEEREKYLRQL
jgi:spore cortex formation protein SpoVR/YcgB (stage V sporulation)